MSFISVKISDFCLVTDFVANGSFESLRNNVEYLQGDGYAVLVRLTDFTKKWNGDFKYVSEKAYEFLKHSKLFPNDLIMSNVGEPGKVFLLPDLGKPMTLGPNSILIRPDENKALSSYLHYYFQSSLGQEQISKITSGTTQKKFNKTSFRSLSINLPSLSTQQKIVKKLDAIFAEIDRATVATEANVKNAEALFQRYLKKTFEENFDWKKATIGEVLSTIKNGINCEQNKTLVGDKITRIETIARKKFDFQRVGFATLNESEKERSRLKYGDILFSHINSPIHVGKTAIYESEEEIYHGINLLLMRTRDDVNPFFFNYFLNYLFATGYWARNCKKSVNQASVNQKDISKVEFSFPQTSIQQELVIKFRSLSLELSKLSKSYANKLIELSILKQSILKQAFKGEMVKE